MAPERPRGEQSGSEPGSGLSASPPCASREVPARFTTPLSPLGDPLPATPPGDLFGPSATPLSGVAVSPSATPLSPLAASASATSTPLSAAPVSPIATPTPLPPVAVSSFATPLSPLADDSSRPVAAASAPGADTAFMEQVLLELSAQNEHARQEQGTEPGAPAAPAARGAAPPAGSPSGAAPGASPPGAPPPRTRTVRVERDSEFRTPEGIPSARAYLPARTLAPGHTEPIEADRVRVADPRRLPTVRLPRDRRDPAPRKSPGRAPQVASGLARSPEWSAPVPDETAPTLRSASPALMPPRRLDTRKWIGWLIAAALVGALVVAAIRFRSSRSGASPSPAPSPGPSVGAVLVPSARPSAASPTATAAPEPAASAPTTESPDASAAPDASTHPPPGRKSDRWF